MLHLSPASIRHEHIATGAMAPLEELLPQLRAQGVKSVSRNGVLGDPRGANVVAGQEIFSSMLATVIGVAAKLLDS
jgi:creatinine amidohydrolase